MFSSCCTFEVLINLGNNVSCFSFSLVTVVHVERREEFAPFAA